MLKTHLPCKTFWWRAVVGLLGLATSACATGQAQNMNLLITLGSGLGAAESVQEALARVAGLPILSWHVVGGRRVAVTFVCTSAQVCETGLQRLQADQKLVESISPDERRAVPRVPQSGQERR